MTTSTKHIQKKATQHFTLVVLCGILFITSSIAWYKHYEVNQYQRNAPTFIFNFTREMYEESEYIRWLYAIGPAIRENPLFHMLEAYLGASIACRGVVGFKEFVKRVFSSA